MRILLISGSTRSASTNTAALRTAALVAPEGMTAILFGGLAALPAFVPDADDDAPHPAVRDLRHQVEAADAVLISTPEYAGSLPGSLKNLLDWLVGTGELNDKPVAWLSVAAPGRGTGATAQLKTVLGYVDAEVVEAACRQVPVARAAVGADGLVADEYFRTEVVSVLRALVRWNSSGDLPHGKGCEPIPEAPK